MLFDNDVNPHFDLYFLGAKLIDVFVNEDIRVIAFNDLFHVVNRTFKMSISLFILTMDWLFLLGLIKFNSEEEIERCF